MSTPSRFKKDKEIIAEYESQVKGTDGSGCLAPFVCFLVIVLRELRFLTWGSALEEGGERQLERLVEPSGASCEPGSVPVPSGPRGAGNPVALPRCPLATSNRGELALN